MTKLVGYAWITGNAKGITAADKNKFKGSIVRVLEFGRDGCILAIDSECSEIAMIEKSSIASSFKCEEINGMLVPPDLDMVAKMAYASKLMTVAGGYDPEIKKLVITKSMIEGKYCDDFIFADIPGIVR